MEKLRLILQSPMKLILFDMPKTRENFALLIYHVLWDFSFSVIGFINLAIKLKFASSFYSFLKLLSYFLVLTCYP